MSARGDYRAVYSVLHDSDEFKRLSKDGKLLWYGVKHSCGLAGIDVVFDEPLAERSGLTMAEIEPARQELIREGWIQVEGRVHWLINGLRFEPNVTLSNPKHRQGILRHLAGLPKLQIANRMASHYGLPIPFPSLPNGSTNPSDTHSIAPRITEPLTLAVDVDVDGTGDGDERGSARARGSATPDVETPDFDGYTPTEAQRARAAELRVDLTRALNTWRGKRKANPPDTPIADLGADFDWWLEQEPQYQHANGNGAREISPVIASHARIPWTPPPDDAEPVDPATRAAGLELVRAAIQATKSPSDDPTISDPEVIARREAEVERQRGIARRAAKT